MKKKCEIFDVVVIGAGPAGLFAAITAAGRKKSVALIEKMENPGRKLLITGSGQCNVTHIGEPDELMGHYNKGRFLKKALYSFTGNDVQVFFTKAGVSLKTTDKGKVFPVSDQAGDILDALLSKSSKVGVQLRPGSEIDEVIRSDNNYLIRFSNGKTMSTGKLVIATGGMSYPKTGSSGDGYKIAKQLGHTIVPPKPGLTDVRINDHILRVLAGISFENIGMEIWRKNRKVFSHIDDMLITHYGFSGPVVLNRSREIMKGDTIVFDFTGMGSAFNDTLRKSIKEKGSQNLSTILKSFNIPNRLVKSILENLNIKADKRGCEINRKEILALVEGFSASAYPVASSGGFNNAMVTAGGVDTKEIRSGTMESVKSEGLFFAGEVMDVDGETGGYNLQAAFSTGYLAGMSV